MCNNGKPSLYINIDLIGIYLINNFVLILVKKAYRQLALRYHPDRTDIDQKEEAKVKFQIIGKVYAILSDEEKRKIYDDTGNYSFIMKYLSIF